MRSARNRRWLLAVVFALAAVLVIASTTGAAPGTDADVTVYDQCANGQPPSTSTACPDSWINGILNANNSHYAEDEVTPQRVVLDLPKNGPTTGRTVEISYLTRKGGVHAYDSLATWNHTQTTADRCADINASDCVPGPETTFPIPPDGTVVADSNGGGSATSAHQLGGQVFTMYGGTITGVSSYTHDDPGGSSDSYAHITLTYSVPSLADDAKVMLLFGGHLAPSLGPRGWGVGVGAGSISGGPYHIRITAADGASVGNRDNQIMSGAILAPASLVIEKVAVGGDGTFDYTATGGISSAFSIATSGGSGSQSFPDIAAGSYTVTEAALPAGWEFTGLQCVDEDNGTTVDLATRTANIDLDSGETVTCTYTNTKRGKIIVEKQTSPDGDSQLFSFSPSYGSSFQLSDGQQSESGFLVAGTYSVSETVPSGWSLASSTCDDGSSPSAIGLAAGETVKCTFTNAKDGKVIVKKAMVGGTSTFDFSGTPAGSISANNGTIQANVVPGQYSSTEAAKAGWDLTSVSCDDTDSTGSVANRQATFNVAAGETVTCTFTNTKQATVIVKKVMVGGTETFDFTGTPAGSISANNGTIEAAVAPGQHVSTEVTEPGWSLTSVSCDDNDSTGSVANRQATFNVAAGETVTCTFTNTKQATVIVKKVMVGGTETFDFTGTPAGSISANDGTIQSAVAPGQHVSTEVAEPGWNLTSVSCDDTNSVGSVANRTATFNVVAGETVTCTFTNTKQAQVIVKKVMVGGTSTFDFTGTPAGSISANNGTIDAFVAPGQHVSTEAVESGWDLTGVSCDDSDSVGSVANRTATFNVAAGETVTCTFTNTKRAQVIVKKVMVGGTSTFDFTGSPAGSISVNNGTIDANVGAGQYVSTEAAKAGWDLTGVSCDDSDSVGSVANRTATFNVAAGEVVTCTFTNTKRARVIVKKAMVGGTEAFDFAGNPAGSISVNNGTIDELVTPGQYVSTETAEAGWELTSVSCNDGDSVGSVPNRTATFNVAAGEVVTCTFTNAKLGSIVVEKQTNPADDPETFGFTGEIVASLADNGTADKAVSPGTYTVTESAESGWDLSQISCNDGNSTGDTATRTATFVVAAGESVKCTFTNVKDGRIIVEKQTNPAGDSETFGFTGEIVASLADNGTADKAVSPGTYTVTESAESGWDLEGIACDDGNSSGSTGTRTATYVVAAGETVKCSFTNEKDARIVVEKQTLPNGDPQSFHFDASYDEGGFNLVDDQQNDSGDLDPGMYDVSEDVPAGWDLTSALCSDESDADAIELSAGETVTCVFTNTKRGSIVVEKQTNPNGAAGTFTFTGDAAGSIGDNGQIVVSNLEPGTYTSTEGAASGFDLTGIECNDANSAGSVGTRTATFDLQAGETVKCTFTNTLIPTITGQGSIDVQKSADPTSIKEPGGPVNFTVTITNTSSLNVTITNVVDSVFGDLDDDGGSGVFDVPINLVPGEKVSKTFQRQVTGVGGQVHTNVVTASGTDAAGNAVSDSDDARVEITPRLIDLVIVKTASSPTPLNGIVNYTMTVTNKGPDTATNVQLADPAPSGITYLTVKPSKGTCNLTASLITCSLGNLTAGETVTINVTARATAVGTHTNVATVTGGGGRETNPADNVDDAVTIVPAPFVPPKQPKPKPKPVCLTLTVTPKMIKADGRPDRVSVKVTAGNKRVKGTKVTIYGAGVRKSGRSNGKGMAFIRINPRKAGLITITALETNQRVCGPKRIGVVGVFLPPLTG